MQSDRIEGSVSMFQLQRHLDYISRKERYEKNEDAKGKSLSDFESSWQRKPN